MEARTHREWPSHVAVIVAMAGIAAILLWPMLRHMSTALPSWYYDTWIDCWAIWWMRDALWLHPHNPFVSPLIGYPLGAEMYWHNLEPAKSAWGVVLLPWIGPVAARNLIVWTTFPLAGYTAWLFVRYILEREGTPRRLAGAAAFAGACVFTFSRYHLCHAEAHLNLSAIEGIPLYLLFFIRYLDRGRRGDLIALTLAAAYTAFCDSYYLVYSAVLSLLWVVAEAVRHGGVLRLRTLRSVVVRRSALAALCVVLLLSPWLVALMAHAFPAPVSVFHGDTDFAADLAGYFIPDRTSAWLPFVSAKWRDLSMHLQGDNEENGYFLGYLTPVLAIVAARQAFLRDGARWLAFGLVFVVLSLGVDLTFAGSPDLSVWMLLALGAVALAAAPWRWRSPSTRDVSVALGVAAIVCFFVPVTANSAPFHAHLSLPYAVFKTVVPFFGRAGMPDRFVLGATLALAVLFAAFAARVAGRVTRPRAAVAVALLLASVPCVEYRGRPMIMGPLPVLPKVMAEIKAERSDVAVLTDASPLSEFDQIYHGHPISYERLARVPVQHSLFEHNERIYQVLHDDRTAGDPVTPAERAHMRSFLRQYHFRYYVTHFWDAGRDRFVREELGGKVLYHAADNLFAVYRFDDVT